MQCVPMQCDVGVVSIGLYLFGRWSVLFDIVGAAGDYAEPDELVLHGVAEPVPLDALAHGHPGLQPGLVLRAVALVERTEVQHCREVVDDERHVVPV